MISARAVFTPRNDLGRFVPTNVTPAVLASVTAACTMIQKTAQTFSPVDTGALRDSITVDVRETESTTVGSVGPHVPYADYVEYGTGLKGDPSVPHTDKPGMVAQPYMRPALDESKPSILDLFRSNVSTGIRNG